MIKIFIATIFLLHGLAPLPGVSFGFVVAASSLLLGILGGSVRSTSFRLDDGLFGLLFVLGLAPFLSMSNVGVQNLLYSLLLLGMWVVCFWWVRECIIVRRLEFSELSTAASVGSMLLAVSIILEFFLANTAGIYLSDIFYFSIEEFPEALMLGDAMKRPRGFTSEAGFSAIVFECLLPLTFDWLKRGRIRRFGFCALVLPAYLVLFSAASLLALGLMLLIFFGLHRGLRRSIFFGGLLAIPGIFFIATSDTTSWLLEEMVGRKLYEFTSEGFVYDVPTFTRPEAYSLAWKILVQQPWGIGWGAVSQAMADNRELFGVELRGSGLISIPLEVGASAGVLGLVIYLLILWRKLLRLAQINSLPARLTFMSLLWVSLHHAVVLELWFPMIWLSLALADVVAVRRTRQSTVGWNVDQNSAASERVTSATGQI